MENLGESIVARFNYWIYVLLMMIGLYAMIAKKNLIKKLIGMSIFQTAIILFFVSAGVKKGSTIPIIHHEAGHHDETTDKGKSPNPESPSPALPAPSPPPGERDGVRGHPGSGEQLTSREKRFQNAVAAEATRLKLQEDQSLLTSAATVLQLSRDSSNPSPVPKKVGAHAIEPAKYANPLPHVLMLTAIVVGVATLGVGLAMVQKIYRDFDTLEEDEIIKKIRSTDG